MKIKKGLKTFLINLIIIVSSIFVTSVFIEIGYRVYLKAVKPVTIMTPDGLRFLPHGSGIYRGGKTSCDKYGFRNALDSIAWNKKIKIMLLGDSVGFGMGVDDDETISHNLNCYFNRFDIGFLNLCRPGWDTPALRDMLYEKGPMLKPWDMVIRLYYINDAKSSTRYTPPLPAGVSSIDRMNFSGKFQHFIFRFFKWPFIFKPRLLQLFNDSVENEDPRRTSWESYYEWCISSYELNSQTRKNEKKYIYDIVNWCQKNKTKLLFILLPAENQFNDGHTEPQEFVKSLGERYDFPVVDLMPRLALANSEKRIFLPGQSHLNSYGNSVVASIISSFLLAGGKTYR